MENLRLIDSLLPTDTIEVNHLNGKTVISKDALANSLSSVKIGPVSVSGAATNVNLALSSYIYMTLEANTTLSFTNAKTGVYILQIRQDSTGSRIITWPADVRWPGGVAPTLTTTPLAWDFVTLIYDGVYFSGTSTLNFVA